MIRVVDWFASQAVLTSQPTWHSYLQWHNKMHCLQW